MLSLTIQRKRKKHVIRLRVWKFAFSVEFPVRRAPALTA